MFFNSNMTLEEAISKYESKNKEDLEKVNNKDDLIESDLFNLIDSMYEKKNQEMNKNVRSIIDHNL